MLSLRQRILWTARLVISKKVRIYLHLPIVAKTRSEDWVTFPTEMRDRTISEIEDYLKERFPGLSYSIWDRSDTQGKWHGEVEKNAIYFFDFEISFRDIDWFFSMKQGVWKERFDQYEIYMAFQQIWD